MCLLCNFREHLKNEYIYAAEVFFSAVVAECGPYYVKARTGYTNHIHTPWASSMVSRVQVYNSVPVYTFSCEQRK